MSRPLVIELFCGMFGWSAGWLALGGEAIGFDIEHQPYHGPVPKGAHLVLQDVLTLHGSQFKDASLDSRRLRPARRIATWRCRGVGSEADRSTRALRRSGRVPRRATTATARLRS